MGTIDVYKRQGYNLPASKDAVLLSNKFENVFATCGISPNDIDNFKDNDLNVIEKIAIDNKKRCV